MKKVKIFLIAAGLVLTSNLALGQCPSGTVHLESQSDISQFLLDYPNCEDLNGSLFFMSDSVTDVSGLSNIKTVVGVLGFHQTACEVVSFPNLTDVDRIYFHQNHDLDSVDLSQVDGTVDRIYFHQNSTLKKVEICALDSVSQYVYFHEDFLLNDLCLDQLTTINEYLYITSCTALTNLNTFSNLVSVGESLYITNNSSLTDCRGLCPLLDIDGVAGEISIFNNPSECSSLSEVTSACSTATTNDLSLDGDFVVFPNPTTGPIEVRGLEYENISVFDVSGKLVKYESSKNANFDISELELGVYWIKLNTKKGQVAVRVLKF